MSFEEIYLSFKSWGALFFNTLYNEDTGLEKLPLHGVLKLQTTSRTAICLPLVKII
jgi:hypothetical protein